MTLTSLLSLGKENIEVGNVLGSLVTLLPPRSREAVPLFLTDVFPVSAEIFGALRSSLPHVASGCILGYNLSDNGVPI